MESNPKSTQSGVLEDRNNRGKTVMTRSDKEQNHQEIVIISDDDIEEDESPMMVEGEASQQRPNQQKPHVTSQRWTLSEDWKLIELVSTFIHSSHIWKRIAAKFAPRSSDSCRVRWTKLLKCNDRCTTKRWAELADYLTVTREDLRSLWSQRISAKSSHPSSFSSSVQNVGSMITNPSTENGEEEIVGDNGDTSTTAIGPSSPGSSSVFPALDLNISLDPDHNQTSSSAPPSTTTRPFYNFLGVDSE